VDIRAYFDSIPHDKLMTLVARRIVDSRVLGLIKSWLDCVVEEKGHRWKPDRGVPQGGVISPLLANIYLHVLDDVWERRGYTRRGGPNVQLVRYADDLVLLTNKDAAWAMDRLRSILHRLGLELNLEKSRVVNAEEQTFDFLGFTFRRVNHQTRPTRVTIRTPSKKAQARLRERIRVVFSPKAPVTVEERVRRMNPVLRGWANYFRIGNASHAFKGVRRYVNMKLRHVLQRQAGRHGYGWKRYDSQYIYGTLGLYNDYRIRWSWSRS
jgi:group II intron reverse transcriptase/maturase